MNRRLIGEYLPLDLINKESTAEKNRSGKSISTIHQWFARRPLTASRATAYAALIDLNKIKKRDAIKTLEELSYYKNMDNNDILKKAHEQIVQSNNGKIPKVLDPFGGGGSIPLECMRLGCETYSNDYNPVAHMIQKATLYYPQKYGQVITEDAIKNQNLTGENVMNVENSKLIADIEKYSEQIENEAWGDLKEFFPKTKNGTASTYIWARTIPCQNPNCHITIPILSSYLLDKKNNISMCPIINKHKITFKVVGKGYEEISNDYNINGNSTAGYVTCQKCNNTIKAKEVNNLLQENLTEQLVMIVERPSKGIKMFIPPTEKDFIAYDSCKEKLSIARKRFIKKYNIDPIPTEIIETPDGKEYKQDGTYFSFSLGNALSGYTKYEHLYNNRQQLVIITLFDKIKNLYINLINENKEYAKCITTYMCFILDALISKYGRLSGYHAHRSLASLCMTGSAIKKTLWYAESNPFDKGGLYTKRKNIIIGLIQAIKSNSNSANLTLGSATNLQYKNNYFDAIFTDPPYYDFVPYSDFSDIYYVWLKRGLGDVFPEVFKTRLSPKRQELVVNDTRAFGYRSADANKNFSCNLKNKQYYEDKMAESVTEMYRVLKPDGIVTLVYTHSSLNGWETLIKAIKRSGFVITAAWPLNTEKPNRMSAQNKASVQSSIYMVGRKWEREEIGLYSKVKKEMQADLKIKLKEFSSVLNKTDYLIAAIGFALEYFTKYETVIEDSGKEVSVCKMLDDIRKFTLEHKMEELTNSKITDSGIARLYIMYRWMYGEKTAPYDHARKIFQGCGINMDEYDIVVKTGSNVEILNAFERNVEKIPEDNTINILHKIILYRDANKTEEAKTLLEKYEYANNDVFKNIASGIVRVQEVSTKETREISNILKSHEMQKGTLDNFTDKKLNNNKNKVVT